MYTDVAVHPQATTMLHTGNFRFVRPSMGAWVLYGLGTENQDLPGFLTINPAGGTPSYASAFLPASYQGTKIEGVGGGGGRAEDRPGSQVANIENPKLTAQLQRKQLDLLGAINREQLDTDKVNPELEGVIESYELAFRMEGAVPEVMDLSSEKKETLAAYGIDEEGTDRFGRQCLLARRFAEKGVRFIELGFGNWDQHSNLKAKLTTNAHAIDKPIAALLGDLKQRGMLKDTLVVWGGEFGRTPAAQGKDGRDHNNKGFSMWMAGGGVKGRPALRRHRRARHRRGRKQDAHQRPARHDAVSARAGPHQADLPVQRPRNPADRSGRQGRQGHRCLVGMAYTQFVLSERCP